MGDKKVANSVVALSSAAVLAIYGAGYTRTRAAADRFAEQAAERRPHIPAPRGERDTAALDLGSPSPAPAPIPPAETAATAAPSQAAPPLAVATLKVEEPAVPQREKAVPKPAIAKAEPAASAVATPASIGTPATDGEEPTTVAAAAAPAATRPAEPATPPPAPVAAPPAPDTAKSLYKDGTYYGWGTSRHGDIQAAVTIESGRIMVARVERCLTRYSCSWITPIPPRILLKQGTTYDYVSGATESSDAFQDAVSEALSQAK